MRILNLIEDTKGAEGCVFCHGLCFYIEANGHKILVDLGPSDDTIKNTEILGIDLKQVDTVVLTHGHYDHSGGIMPFCEKNSAAKIYMQKTAVKKYYALDGNGYRYIGIDEKIGSLQNVIFLQGDHTIDDGFDVFTVKQRTWEIPFTNRRLMVEENGRYVNDTFDHEQHVAITEGNDRLLVSGCAHNGILNIMDTYVKKYGYAPDTVISGFHLAKKTDYTQEQIKIIEDIAVQLDKYPSRFFTCHCTGTKAYEIMKDIMGEKLVYIRCGETVEAMNEKLPAPGKMK